MPIIYRSAGPWGAGKGANLVAGEVDGNFYDISTRVTVVEDKLPELVSVDYFSVSGSSFYIHLTDGTIQGPFALPVTTWNFRGVWKPNTSYAKNDIVTAVAAVYMVLVTHTSAATFDPGANNNSSNYYGLLLQQPACMLPAGGVIGEVLVKTSDTVDYATRWQAPSIFPAAYLMEAAGPTYTLTFNNIASYVRCVNGSGCTIIVPADATLDFPLSTEISFRQCTAGQVVLQKDAGVIFNTIDGFQNTTAKTGRNGAVITIKKIADNNWDVFGLLGV